MSVLNGLVYAMSQVAVLIEIGDDDKTNCGSGCAFLQDGGCLLFSTPLDDVILSKDRRWQDGQAPYKERCYRCTSLSM